jgi:hypothetical protein
METLVYLRTRREAGSRGSLVLVGGSLFRDLSLGFTIQTRLPLTIPMTTIVKVLKNVLMTPHVYVAKSTRGWTRNYCSATRGAASFRVHTRWPCCILAQAQQGTSGLRFHSVLLLFVIELLLLSSDSWSALERALLVSWYKHRAIVHDVSG